MAWFKQEAAQDGTFLPNGHRVTLDLILDDGDGYLATENGFVVNQVRAAIASKSHGWVEITEADYNEAVKKKANPVNRKSARNRLNGLNAGMFQPRESVQVAPFAEVVNKPDPIQVPKPEEFKIPPRPRVGKMVNA